MSNSESASQRRMLGGAKRNELLTVAPVRLIIRLDWAPAPRRRGGQVRFLNRRRRGGQVRFLNGRICLIGHLSAS